MVLNSFEKVYLLSIRLPSHCGVARHHECIVDVLSNFGSVQDLSVSGDAAHNQSLFVTLRTIFRLVLSTPTRSDLVFVEVAGRLISNFYALLFCQLLFPKSITCIYLHDSPSICGDVRLFAEIDRKGLRWIRHLVVPTVNIENYVLSRSVKIVTSKLAAGGLSGRYGATNVSCMPLVYFDQKKPEKGNVCFVPGVLDSSDAGRLINCLTEFLPNYEILIGKLSGDIIGTKSRYEDSPNITFLGDVSDDQLIMCYERAEFVVRYRPSAPAGNNFAASGPVIYAMQAGCVFLSDDFRGSIETVDFGAALRFSSDLSDLGPVLRKYSSDLMAKNALLARASTFYSLNHTRGSGKATLDNILTENIRKLD
jgi:hypothetical protein